MEYLLWSTEEENTVAEELSERLQAIVRHYLPAEQISSIQRAYRFAYQAHQGQYRSSGELYITHPLSVAIILAEMHLDQEALIAALLHDVIEDTATTASTIAEQFGPNVAQLVEGVSKLDRLKFRNRQEAKAENFCKMIMAMVQDIRVILIKLSDRLHNMRTLEALRPSKRRRIARETLEIYAPLAHRLGIHHLKIELEELGFEAHFPNRYRVLKNVVKAAHGNRGEIIGTILSEIESCLSTAGLEARISGREKHLYSIYQKMKQKEQRFHSIMDIYAFRVIVKQVDSCYRVLGQIHALYKPRPGRFKDYIAIPKANGYQSLHTSMMGPLGFPVEVQIRTEDMDQMAEMGVAAHWSYKQAGGAGTMAQIRAQRWMKNLLELQQSAGSSVEFIESVKSDLCSSEIYVFTPKGRIVELPAGATPIDFAYAVHTDIGHSCVGSRVDRQSYPLSQPLNNGQTVEIITASGSRPNAAWMNFIVTSKARAKIRQRLKCLGKEDSIKSGRYLLEHALGYSIEEIAAVSLQQLLVEMKLNSIEGLLVELGLGNVMSSVIAHRLANHEHTAEFCKSSVGRQLPIRGVEGILVTFSKCCRPIPGDPIVGYASPGKGLAIHHELCRNIRSALKGGDKFISIAWGNKIDQEFMTEIKVDMVNYQGALSNLLTTVNSANSMVNHLSTEERDGRVYQVQLRFTVHHRQHLADIMRRIKNMPNVLKVIRNRN
ncbi:MAG: bifunctional GTP diphosphokinase/guanosine-3',5'-bis pyrophosphate 3'-pyrophosphohydrolase [Candidatus Symbiodolus clandestinus]